MYRKHIAGAAAVLGLLLSGTAMADRGHAYGRAYARVMDVEPIVQRIAVERPRRECWQETEYLPARPSGVAGPTIAGGIIGAAIGRQFGDGSGRDALTLLGAAAGSAIANERALRRRAADGRAPLTAVPVERCATTVQRVTEERVTGYWVTYRFRGQTYRSRMHEHPGDRIRLELSGRPVGYRGYGAY